MTDIEYTELSKKIFDYMDVVHGVHLLESEIYELIIMCREKMED